MIINRNNILRFVVAFMLLVNILVAFDVNEFYIRAILAFIFIITIPGLLIMLILRVKEVGFWEYLVYTVGLSVAFIMFAGLAVNWILPWLNITDKPLSLWPILISFDIFLLIMGFFAYQRNKDLNADLKAPQLDVFNQIFFIIPMLFPVLAVLGAFILNNGGSNILTMIMLGGIAAYVLAIVIFRKRLNENVYPWALWMIGLSLLLSKTLRSWYVTGYDISTEFNIFSLAFENSRWIVDISNNIYNYCLSITILPTVINNIVIFDSFSIFKLFFPIIFSIIPISLFLLSRKLFTVQHSFLSTLFIVSIISFVATLSAEIRQGTAFLFYIYLLMLVFDKKLNTRIRKLLFIIFGISMILSHYSTSILSITILIFTCAFYYLNKNRLLSITENGIINWKIILFLFLFSFLWYNQVTPTSNSLVDFVDNSISNLHKIWTSDMKSVSVVGQTSIFNNRIDLIKTLKDYNLEKTSEYANKTFYRYDKSKYSGYRISYTSPKPLPNFNPSFTKLSNFVYLYLVLFFKIFLIAGILYSFYKRKKLFNNQTYIIFAVIFFILIILIILLPYISLRYDIDRLYLQSLFVLSAVQTIGAIFLFGIFIKNKNISIYILTSLILLFLLFNYGFIGQITGGNSVIWLNNLGQSYDLDYVHKGELLSSSWVISQKFNSIYADYFAKNRLIQSGINIDIKKDVIPLAIEKNSVVYSSYSNKVNKIGYIYYQTNLLPYNYPSVFLNSNKNKVYSNDESEVFK